MTSKETKLPVLDDTLYWELPVNNPPRNPGQAVDIDALVAELESKGKRVSESLRRAALDEKMDGYRQRLARRQLRADLDETRLTDPSGS